MGNLVFTLLDMSLAAGWVALIVMVLRFLLKKAPRALVCALWALVAVRLVCPITWQAPWSLMPKAVSVESYVTMSPSAEVTPSQDAQTVVTVPPSQTAPPVSSDRTPTQTSETPTVDGFAVAAVVWMVGVVGMLAYAVVSTVRLRRQVRASVRIEKGIYECDTIASPFILGLFRPRIYLPSCMTQAERDHVIAHERAHIKRLDHAIKPFGFLLLSIYWFHPLLWLAYALLCRDMELACDERVIRRMNGEDKASYSEILLKYSLPQRAVTACPLGFGEGAVKTRIRAIVNYKKPTFWIVAIAVSALVGVGVFFLLDPPDNTPKDPIAVPSEETVPYEYVTIAKPYSDKGRGYAVVDLDKDGQTELIIGQLDSSEVHAWYTLEAGTRVPAQLCQSLGNDHYYLYADGMMKREWEGENGAHGWDWYCREQSDTVLIERIVCDPTYAMESGRLEQGVLYRDATQAAYYRSEYADKERYAPISYDEAMALVKDWDSRYAPLTFSLRSFAEPIPIDETSLPMVQCRFAEEEQKVQMLPTDKAMELYRYLISLAWEQGDVVYGEEEMSYILKEMYRYLMALSWEQDDAAYGVGQTPYIMMGFSGDGVSGVYWIRDDDTMVFTGAAEMSSLWGGKLPEGTYRELVRRIEEGSVQTTEVLRMPESIVYGYDHYDGTYTLKIYGNGETALTFFENEEEPVVVDLSQDQIVELNTLYESIEDFTSPVFEPNTTMTVDGETVEFCMEWTAQVELEQYMRLLECHYHGITYNWLVEQYDGAERWNERMLPYAYKDMESWMAYSSWARSVSVLIPKDNLEEIEAFDGNVYQYFARFGMDYVRKDGDRYYACYRSEEEVLTVFFDRNGKKRGTERKPLGPQGLPDEIVISDMYWAAPTFTVTFTDNGEISFAADYDEEVNKIVPLTPQEFDELRQLFVEIYDYRSLFGDSEENGNTFISYDGNQYRCDSFFTTQVELEQFLSKIKSYYTGEEYDWRVEQERGYIRYNERMLPYAYKDMEFWMEWACPNISSLPVENLGRIETFDGNVYEYFCNFGMDYVRKDGDRYYACYRSEDEVLTVWFDRQGTKLETKRSPL